MDVAVIDLGFGDAGKGTVVDWLSRRHPGCTVVRSNGGCQAYHCVVEPGGRFHGFSQFGSGTFAGARTHLSRFMLVQPMSMMVEAKRLAAIGETDIFARVTIDPGALITTPYHRAVNRLLEIKRGGHRHGSCGQGIGVTAEYALLFPSLSLRGRDLADVDLTTAKLDELRRWCWRKIGGEAKWEGVPLSNAARTELDLLHREPKQLAGDYRTWAQMIDWRHDDDLLPHLEHVIYEGAQGVLIDENAGFQPHTTWSRCTDINARTIAVMCGRDEPYVLGLTRSYATRHGAGPFPTEGSVDLVGAEMHNGTDPWQGGWRTGALDAVALSYAISQCELVDGLGMTHLDTWPRSDAQPVCHSYRLPDGTSTGKLDPLMIEEYTPEYVTLSCGSHLGYASQIAEHLGLPLALTSSGPTHEDKRWMDERWS